MPRPTTAQRHTATARNITDPTSEKSILARQIEIVRTLQEHERYNRLESYDPLPFQQRFHETGADCHQRALMAGNRVDKSFCGAAETALHLTGLYPKWWKGRRYKNPIVAWVGGVSNETVRDILQDALLGTPGNPDALGTGAIPRGRERIRINYSLWANHVAEKYQQGLAKAKPDEPIDLTVEEVMLLNEMYGDPQESGGK
jgi:hypothetical protein